MTRTEAIAWLSDLLFENDRQFLPTVIRPKHVDALEMAITTMKEKERDTALPAERGRDHPNCLFKR